MAVKRPKGDPAHEETERLIADMEKRISKEYAQAEKEVQFKINDYFDRFRLKDQKWQEWVADGKKTAAEYKQWRICQMAVGKRWESMKQTIAEDFAHTDQIARSIVKGYMPEVYATNFNYGTYEVEVGAKVNTSFTLYDRQTVERIMRDNPDLLPAPGKKVSKAIAEGKAVRWNKQLIQSVMTQGILQGESIPKLATRLAKEVGDSDRKAAIRNARTMATGAQNAGRVDSYKRAEDMGIEMEQEWRATLDMRTRHEHRQLDGQRQKVGEPFTVDGYEILFPGDPSAEGFLVWNCRCTLRGVVAGLEPQARKYRDESALEGLTYDEWKAQKKSESNPITLPEEKGEAIAEKFRREYRDGVFGGSLKEKVEYTPQSIEAIYGVKVDILEAGKYEKEALESVSALGRLLEGYNSTAVSYTVVKSVTGTEAGSAYMLNGKTSIQVQAKALRNISATDDLRLGDKQYLGVTFHEFAHSLSQSREKMTPEFWKEMRKLKKEYQGEINSPDWFSKKKISSYAEKDVDEFMAEAFTQAKLSNNPSEYSLKALEIIDKYFKKEK
jgi:SPP1 gp7 family putative phage head morphogenesis protein